MTDKQFANGINYPKVIETKYGQMIKFTVNKNYILDNPYDENGILKVVLKTAKSGNMYAEVDTFTPDPNYSSNSNNATNNTTSNDKLVEFGEMDVPEVDALISDEEIPF